MVRKQLAYFSPACHNKTTRVIIKQKQKQEHSSPWTTASRKHGNGAMKTAVSLTPPDGKGTALNTMLTGHPSSKAQCNHCRADRGRTYSVGYRHAHGCFWLALKERNSFREQRP